VAAIALVKFALELHAAPHYGIFRDEMYYLACGQHLGWGYVDHPPLMPFIAWLVSHTLGTSLLALRLLPALAGAALVLLTGAMARKMGGDRMAQALAALAVLTAPIYMLMQHWFTMNAFEPVLWMACAWCVLRSIETGNPRWWLWIGVLCGIGLEMKYTIVLFAAGLLLGLALTPHRRVFASKWFWLGSLAAFLIFLPHFIWLVQHHFPFLEYEHNVRSTPRDVRRGPIAFFLDQAQILNPVSAVLWVLGLLWLLFTRTGARYSILAWTFLVVYGTLMITQGKNYYVSPVYPMMFAAGAVAFTLVPQFLVARRLHGVACCLGNPSRPALSPTSSPRNLPPLRARARHGTGHQSRESTHRPPTAVFCRRIRLGGHGPQNRRRL
jgi:4-amino-4-deoxy-L-arabinose transferase-like glycosyltransferase